MLLTYCRKYGNIPLDNFYNKHDLLFFIKYSLKIKYLIWEATAFTTQVIRWAITKLYSPSKFLES